MTRARDVADRAVITTADLVNIPSGAKNLIINGDMRIAQRGTSSTGVTSGNNFVADRFMWQVGTGGTWTLTQDTDVPTGQGFANSMKLACTTANASLSAGSYGLFLQRIEGLMLQHLKKGTSSAEKLTVSFWIKSNKTGTLQSNLRDVDNTRLIGKEFTISVADTWEKKTITFDGDTSGAFDNDNGLSVQWEIWFVAGSDYSGSGSVPTAWEALDNTDRYANPTINLADSTSNYINITGVQLEISDGEATPFEHRPYDMELARCQRYYYRITGTDGVNNHISMGYAQGSSGTAAIRAELVPKVTMRIYNPSVESASGTGYFANSNSMGANTSWDFMILGYAEGYGQSGVLIGNGTSVSGLTVGNAGYVRLSSTGGSNSWIALDAEL